MQNIKEAFGANLRKIRKSRKLTLDALAEMSDITPRLLSKLEAGDTFLSADTLCKISVALDVNLQVLFDFEWYDKLIYYDNGKHIKHHFKVNEITKEKIAKIRSLSTLQDYKINEIIHSNQVTLYFIKFAQTSNKTIYVDYFVDGKREYVFKVTPDGIFQHLVDFEIIKTLNTEIKDKNYYIALEKIRELSIDKKKLEYLITAANALNDKKTREKLRIMLDAMDISSK